MGNVAKWEESTEILLDSEVESPDAGWTLHYVSVLRTGTAVSVHIEASFGTAAAAPICTLQPEFWPDSTVTSPDGKFTLTAAGVLSYTGSTSAAAAASPCQLNFAAAETSP
jgi:hypothetical protein